MKKTGIINAEISAVMALLGHRDAITLVDAGYPIPDGPRRIDLALARGIPTFLQTLAAVLQEMEVERIIMAGEIRDYSPELVAAIEALLPSLKMEFITNDQFKVEVPKTRAVIRTGEFTPYANIILVSGAAGFAL